MSIFYSKINENLNNIWRYAAFYPPIREDCQLSMGEGNTPNEYSDELAAKFGFARLILKREDYNPNGSHKDRMLAYQVSRALEAGEKKLLISSSGNAGVSAAAYCQIAGIKLFVFVSPKTDEAKIASIANFGAYVIISKHSLTLADLAAEEFSIKNLRAGGDEGAYYGLKSIAFEMFEQCRDVDAIFIPTSSASTLLGISSAYNDLFRLSEMQKMPAFYAVQTSKIHPIAEYFDKNFIGENENMARGIISKNIDKNKLAKILKIIKSSNGGGIIVSNHDILEAKNHLSRFGINTGYESAAGFAGAIKHAPKLKNQRIAVILTGKMPGTAPESQYINHDNIFEADNIEDVEKIIKTAAGD